MIYGTLADNPSDEVLHRLENAVANNPIHKAARAKRIAHEKTIDALFNASMPANHPFEAEK